MRNIYFVYIAFILVQRLWETRLSKRNAAKAIARGGKEFFPRHFRVMVVMHSLFLVSCVAEVVYCHRTFSPWIGFPAVVVALLSQAVRYWAITTLGERWNVRIIVVPGLPPVTNGPYKYVRHPNYLAVITEMVAIPLIMNAYLTAIVFTIWDGLLLWVRIRAEEKAFGSVYQESFAERPRFIPGRAA